MAWQDTAPDSGHRGARVHCGSAPLSAAAWEDIRKWTGTRQERFFSVRGDRLTLETTPRTSGRDSREFINTLTWERVEALPAMPTMINP